MSPLGERILEFLRSQSDVAEVRDASTATPAGRTAAEEIACCHRGADYRVTVAQRYPR